MKTVTATELRNRLTALLATLEPEGVVITKSGRPVARLLPVEADDADLIGCLAGKIRVSGEIESTGLRWDAEGRSGRARSDRARG